MPCLKVRLISRALCDFQRTESDLSTVIYHPLELLRELVATNAVAFLPGATPEVTPLWIFYHHTDGFQTSQLQGLSYRSSVLGGGRNLF
jgi:hypothetical protein